jgi:hypothetical protein
MGRLLVARRPGFEIGGDFPSPDMTSGGGRSIFTRAAKLGKSFLPML